MHAIPLSYEALRIIWWLFLAVLITGFAIMDGFDLGVAAQLPMVARKDEERRIAINSIAPFWDGNQVWFILGGGAAFAAFPLLYATAFSGFYAAMFLVLITFIVRPVGFDFRNKVTDYRWRQTWDWALCIAGSAAAILFGVAVGNLFLGVPFHYTDELRVVYEGGLFGLLRPFALLCGICAYLMLLMHGGAYLMVKTDDAVAARARRVVMIAAALLAILFTVGGIWLAGGMNGYVADPALDPAAPSNPLHATAMQAPGAWLGVYGRWPWTVSAPLLAYADMMLATWGAWRRQAVAAFAGTASAVVGILGTTALSLFPFLLPSDLAPAQSLTIWNASSSRSTLFTMFIATVVFLPIILTYTTWAFRVMRGKVTAAYVRENSDSLY